jgi:hypothetical protein
MGPSAGAAKRYDGMEWRFVGCSLGVLASVHGWDAAGLRVWGVL